VSRLTGVGRRLPPSITASSEASRVEVVGVSLLLLRGTWLM
jgi:hypothetical protein